MPTQRIINVYRFEELSDRAKEKAREWYRGWVFQNSCDWDFVFEDAVRMAAILGIEIDKRTYKTVGGGTGTEPAIYFSLAYSQSDYAAFEGQYAYASGATKKIRKEAPKDEVLHRIADRLQAIQRRHFYRLVAKVTYHHYYGQQSEVTDREDTYRDIGEAEKEISDCMKSFANWIYDQLREEYEYQSSDEVVDENIICNEYDFDEEGDRI